MVTSPRKKALVTGACGVIGPILIDCLLSRGYTVRGLDVRSQQPDSFPENVNMDICDLSDEGALKEAVAGIDVIFHLAAKLHLNDAVSADKEDYKEVNVEGTRRVVEVAMNARVQRMVFFSTINVYGSSQQGSVHDETSPIRPSSWYAQTKAQAESIVLAGLPSVVLRLAAVYGPRMKGNYPKLLHALRKGHFFVIGEGQNRRTLVHIRDVCQAALLAAEHPDAVGRVYNVTDGQVHTLLEVIAAMCAALGKKPPRLRLSVAFVRPAFGLLEDGFRLLGWRSPVGRSTVDKLIEDLAVSGERMQQELGFKPTYDLFKGWRESVCHLPDER